jgi:ATP-dependent Clp endopeptidase proteolytic subunit ClpP
MADDDTKLAQTLADYPEVREALVLKLRAEAELAIQGAAVNANQRYISDIMVTAARREEEDALAADRYHHTFQFTAAVNEANVAACIDRLNRWARIDPTCDIEVIFNSPGGSVVSGMALFDFLVDLTHQGHKVTTVALGVAASMAAILTQAGSVRVMGREAWLLIHEISFATMGKIGEVEDTTEWARGISKRVVQIFANRSTMSSAQVEKAMKRKDWWIDSDTALKLGLVDEVR